MSKKDKFAQLQKSERVGSFQDTIVRAASTAAAIQQKEEIAASASKANKEVTDAGNKNLATSSPTKEGVEVNDRTSSAGSPDAGATRYTHLPNPLISVREYNLASMYCSTFDNMTRQDWMELAIIEKLFHDGQMPEEEFKARQSEIRNRPPRGQRKNTKVRLNK